MVIVQLPMKRTFVAAKLRYVAPSRPPSVFVRAFAKVGTLRIALFVSRHLSWKLDPVLLRASRGRLRSTLMIPAAVLETHGARSGARRRNAVLYFHDG